jgi:hypothetical protein
MKIKNIIEALQSEDPESHIMIQWYTREHTEGNLNEFISVEVWNEAVRLTDKWGIDFDETVVEAVNVARDRISESAS